MTEVAKCCFNEAVGNYRRKPPVGRGESAKRTKASMRPSETTDGNQGIPAARVPLLVASMRPSETTDGNVWRLW